MSSEPRPSPALEPRSSTCVLEVKGVDFWFGAGELRKQVLFDVSCRVGAGEIVILEGPSGSGKTTLLTLFGALRTLTSGSIELLGTELRGADEDTLRRLRRRIGFIFQQHNLLPFLTARQNVEIVFRLWPEVSTREARRRSHEALERIGLLARADAFPAQLSGGQKQRVAIARALVAEPDIVLADEPTASLDKQSGRLVVDLMQSMARSRGIPILLVTHDNRILDVADRTLHMEDGRVRGEVQDVEAPPTRRPGEVDPLR